MKRSSTIAPWRTILRPTFLALCVIACLPACQRDRPGATAGDDVTAVPLSAVGPPSSEPEGMRRRGLWVLCEGSQRVLESPERVERLIADAQALAATDLFVQVYRGGRAWYDATLADASPYRAIRREAGVDPLKLLLERAEAAGISVHAWVNVLSVHDNAEAPILKALGRDAVQVDRRGRSQLDYPEREIPPPDRSYYRMGTRGLYLDPAAPGVADWLVSTFDELVARYPRLAGVHLDYIRHPDVLPFIPGSRFGVGLDFGYGESSRARFLAETGLEAPFADQGGNEARWDAWRRERVDALVADIARALRARNPDLQLSAAVASHADRAYLSLYQDWRRWLEEGWLDFAVAMIYTLDDRLYRYQVAAFAGEPEGDRIWAGQGSWLFARRPERALHQLELARDAGAPAEVLFSYDAIADAPALAEALAREPAPGPRDGSPDAGG